MNWVDDHHCFACGKENLDGLQLDFTIEGGKIRTEYTPPKKFQGYAGVVHGGIIGLILDETMVNLPWKLYKTPVVSAELTLRFKKPAKVGEKIFFMAEIEKERGRLVYTKGAAALSDGTVLAEASAKCVKV